MMTSLIAAAVLNVAANVPALMTCADGSKVDSVEKWERVRRPELLRTFLENVYGVRPVERPADLRFEIVREDRDAFGGRAVCKYVRISFGGVGGKTNFYAQAVLPKTAAKRPAPCFLYASFGSCLRPNGSVEGVKKSKYWNPERIVMRGYAAVAFFMDDVVMDLSNAPGYWEDKDKATGRYAARFNRDGVFSVLEKAGSRTDRSWGTISAWAWAASRVMDWIETEPLIDAKRVGVVGHSRGGKCALVAGVTDTRFAMVCSNDSGCSGAKLNHIDLKASEHIAQINAMFPDWFCTVYKGWANREMEMPFDQHQWLALVAPRLLAVGSAAKDVWAGPPGEFAAAKFASPAWELYGRKGLVAADGFPSVDTPLQEGSVSYHLREGVHYLTEWDWDRYMDFADRNGWKGN